MYSKTFLDSIVPYVAHPVDVTKTKLLSNENPLGSSPMSIEAVHDYAASMSLYPCNQSFLLKKKLSEKLNIAEEYIILGNGSDEIFTLMAGVIIQQGDEMVTARTTFSQYAFAAKQFGGNPIYTELEDGKFSIENLLKAITPKTKWIALSNPNNPTGTYLNHSEIELLLNKIPENIFLLVDEAYCEYSNASDFPDTQSLLGHHKNLVITRTFSKLYGLAGLRVGYAIAHPDLISFMNKLRSPYNINSLAQAGALAALDDSQFVCNSLENNLLGKKYLTAELNRLNLAHFPTEGNFIFIHLPINGNIAADSLANKGVLVRATASFGVVNAIRVTIGKPEQNAFFIDCLTKVLEEQ